MAKFGELIDREEPVVICFDKIEDNTKPHLLDLQSRYLDKITVLIMDVYKNKTLAQALGVKETPCVVIYCGGEMKYRDVGVKNKMARIEKVIKANL